MSLGQIFSQTWTFGKQLMVAGIVIVLVILIYALISWWGNFGIRGQIKDVMEDLSETQGSVTEADTNRIMPRLHANKPSAELDAEIENIMLQLQGTAPN